jgi:hypothetical protein
VSCFPNLEELTLPEQEINWWLGPDHSITPREVEAELKNSMRFRGIWDLVKERKGKLSVRCRITVVAMAGRRWLEMVCLLRFDV